MSLSVIIPSRTVSNLVPCVAAVRKHERIEVRIIVVDDGIASPHAMWWQGINRVAGVKPFVFSRAVNAGIRAAGDDDVVLLNDDALLESPLGFSLMQRVAAADERVGIIGAVTDLTGQPHQRRKRDPEKEWVARNVPSYGLRAVDHFAFVCVYIPRRTINALAQLTPEIPDLLTGGLLDERYCLDYGVEDRHYCMQCQKAALLVCVHDACFVNHSSLHSSFRGNPEAPGSFQQNYALYKRKWGVTA